MSNNKQINTRIQHKHDVESNWIKALNFIPKAGEIIVYDPDDNYDYARIKIGDGLTLVNELKFSDGGVGKNVTGTQYTINEETVIAGENAEVFNNYVNNIASGDYSHAEGQSTTATGTASHAEGYTTVASGDYSHAEGWGATATYYGAHAEGAGTLASGVNAHAEGQSTEASSYNTHAEGHGTVASQSSAHAEGQNTVAHGVYAHAEGVGLQSSVIISGAANATRYTVSNYTEALRVGAIVYLPSNSYGLSTITACDEENLTFDVANSLSYSNAINEEEAIIIYGGLAHAAAAHVEGGYSIAEKPFTHAEGYFTIADSEKQHVQGQYNIGDNANTYAHIVGNGNATTRSNAHTLDWDGNAWFAGDVYVGSTSGTNKDEGSVKLATINEAMSKTNPIGKGSFSLNRKSGTHIGPWSFAEGNNTTASGGYSHAEGSNTTASGQVSHAEGRNTTASGDYAHAEGSGTTASGFASHTEGSSTEASGTYSHAEGFDTIAHGDYSHAEGHSTTANSRSQHVQGEYNILDTENIDARGTYAHIVGNGVLNKGKTTRSNAHTLDWSGNAWFAGDVYVGSTSGTNKDNGSKKLATIDEVNTAISSIPTPDVSGQITTHNTSDSAHSDIRELVSELTVRLNTLADSDDTTLDQISEIVNYIKNNKSLIEGVTTNKVNVADIVDNLTTDVANKPLSAAQGVALKSLIDTSIEEVRTDIEPYIFNIDYNTLLAFDTSEIVFDNSDTTSILGKAILGKMILA